MTDEHTQLRPSPSRCTSREGSGGPGSGRVADVSGRSLVPFVCDVVEPGSVVLTDG